MPPTTLILFSICALLSLTLSAFTPGPCPSTCLPFGRARWQCRKYAACYLEKCYYNLRSGKRRNGYKCVTSSAPACPITSAICDASGRAKKTCRKYPGCSLTSCFRKVGRFGKLRKGSQCGSSGAPVDPPNVGCPNKCVGKGKAIRDCKLYSTCTLSTCDRFVRGFKKTGYLCGNVVTTKPPTTTTTTTTTITTLPTTTTTTVPTTPPCPNFCTRYRRAASSCASLPDCQLRVCTSIRGRFRPSFGGICGDPILITTAPPTTTTTTVTTTTTTPLTVGACPEQCLRYALADIQCSKYPLCEVELCLRPGRRRSILGGICTLTVTDVPITTTVPVTTTTTSKVTTDTPTCPNQCGRRSTAKKQCESSKYLGFCKVISCKTAIEETTFQGWICTDLSSVDGPPFPTVSQSMSASPSPVSDVGGPPFVSVTPTVSMSVGPTPSTTASLTPSRSVGPTPSSSDDPTSTMEM